MKYWPLVFMFVVVFGTLDFANAANPTLIYSGKIYESHDRVDRTPLVGGISSELHERRNAMFF